MKRLTIGASLLLFASIGWAQPGDSGKKETTPDALILQRSAQL